MGIKIGDKQIGLHSNPFVIAEMSGNHNQSLDRALKIVKAASKTGVHSLKLQTYTPETMTLDVKEGDFLIKDKDSLWFGKSLYELYQQAQTPWEWHEPIMNLARELGMLCFSTPFDESAVDFLEELNVPAYKIASFENLHFPLLKKVAATNKPMIISIGMAEKSDVKEIIETISEAGCKNFILLKCTSSYPASSSNSNILTIPHMRKIFDCEVGISDHTLGIGAAISAVAQGATVVEKHFTLSRSDGGVDSAFSLEPKEMKQLVIESKRAWESLGKVTYGSTKAEKGSLVYRRSLYITKDMYAGEKLSSNNFSVIRPGKGLPPKYYEKLLGRKIKKSVKKGTPLNWRLLD